MTGTERTELVALERAVDSAIKDRQSAFPDLPRGIYVAVKDVDPLYASYRSVLKRLQADSPALFGLLPDRVPVPVKESAGTMPPRIMLGDLKGLLRDIRQCLDLVPAPAVQVAMAATREGVFFAGQRTDAMKLVLDLIGSAKTRLELIDGYVDVGTLGILTREPKLRVEVLTKPLDSAMAQTLATLGKGRNLAVRSSNAFHDRFLCIDGGDVYHFGASLKDAGARGFMFSRIEEPIVVKALRDEWAREWNSGAVIV